MYFRTFSAIVALLFIHSALCESTAPPNVTVTTQPTTAQGVNSSSTTASPPQCEGLETATCCNTTGCDFISCKNVTDDSANHTGCHVKDADLTSVCAPNSSQSMCSQPVTTVAPTAAPTQASTNKTAGPTTQGPTTSAAPTDPCEAFKENTSCCNNDAALDCTFISCTDKTDAKHTGCHINTTDFSVICKDDPKDECKTDASTSAKPSTAGPTTQAGTTQASGNSSTTEATNAKPQTGGDEHSQHFDGASFVGGMVLVAGLVGIVFFGIKFYKARTERNYHTL